MKQLLVFIFIATFILKPPLALAAPPTSLTVSPAIIENIATPGESTHTKVTLINESNVPLPIKASVSSFAQSESIASWFTLVPSDFILQPKTQQEVIIKIKTPKDVEPGGHYATIYFEPLIPQEALSLGAANSLARVGVLAFLIAPGNVDQSLSLKSFTLPSWQNFGPIAGTLTLENTGNIHLKPSGQFTLTDMFGRTVLTSTLESKLILPRAKVSYELSWNKSFLLGPYLVQGELFYGAENLPLKLTPIKIWIIPIPLVLLTIILLTMFFWFVIVGRKRIILAWQILTAKEPKETTP